MSEKVSFFRSAALESLVGAVAVIVFGNFLEDIDSPADWRWFDSLTYLILGAFWLVKFFWQCGEKVVTGRWQPAPKVSKLTKFVVLTLAALFVATVFVFRSEIEGPREKIDGVTWRYVVKDGKAVIMRTRQTYSRAAISVATSGDLVIPEKLGGYPVVGIGRDAFSGCEKLMSVAIPESVRYVHFSSFRGCVALRKVVINGKLDCNVFDDCIGLKEIVVPSENEFLQSVDGMLLDKKGKRLLMGLGVNVSVPDGVTCIDDYAFAGRTDLESVIIPNSVTNIGMNAFSGCKKLLSVVIPPGVSNIAYCVFQDCEALSSVSIPDGVRTIGAFAFAGCRSLKTLELPESVVEIGNDAFSDCSKLVSVDIPSNCVYRANKVFAGTPFSGE